MRITGQLEYCLLVGARMYAWGLVDHVVEKVARPHAAASNGRCLLPMFSQHHL